MKVEKSKKIRVHKVKQGTPPKLSASQKRKLVRLYVFTNLSWKEISELILHFGRRDMKKRALQYTLQSLLSVQYYQMRPRDTSARRQRALQMQRYLDTKHLKKVKSTKSKATSPPSKSFMLQDTGSNDYTHGEPSSSTSIERSEPTMSPKRDQIYFNEFDRLIDVTGYPQDSEFQLLFNEGTATSIPPSSSTFDRGADQLFEANDELELPELEGDLKWPADPLPSERCNEQDVSPEFELNAADADLQFPLDITYRANHSDTREPIPQESQNRGSSVAYAQSLPDSTPCDNTLNLSGHSAHSSLTNLVDRLSKCSLGNPWWVDRFGNTSLHIAAALGATCEELQDIIMKGEVSTQLMTSDNLPSLTDFLRRSKFKFDHRDVMGYTFIDFLKSCGVGIANCYPASVVYSFRKELYEAGKTAEVVPPWSDEWREAWSYSRSTSLYELYKVPKHILSRFKYFADYHGQNYLHIAVGNTKIPSDVSEQTFPGSRLSLVRDLLSIGVELDHHDNLGETPLMTHIRTVPEQDDIILELLHSGADVNARNEKGETALHISVRLGDIVGTKALLAQRATVNVHVRNWKGQGLLAVAAKAAQSAKDDVGLCAKITTCMALAIDSGAIMAPTRFDEWDLREPTREILRKDGFLVAPKEEDH
ncbi:MAG: hypothetical protein Q9176_006372 [Flavoplaca citrina]